VSQENYSTLGAAIGLSRHSPIVPQGNSLAAGSDEDFQKLLFRLSKAGERAHSAALISLFCRATCEFFHLSGVYFWRCHSGDELIGEQAFGKMSERFVGLRIRSDESAVSAEAVRQRRTIFKNHLDTSAYPAAMDFDAHSILAAPLIVLNDVIGAVTFLHDADDDFFNDDFAAKATILAGQLGSLLEAARLGELSREEHRRAEILADVANVLHGSPDVAAVIEALADRLRILLRTKLVCVFLRQDGPFELKAVSAETPQLATSARARHDRHTLRFAADLAQRAVAAGEPITLSIGADVHSMGNLGSAGMLLAAPFRTSRTQGAILIYPRQESVFTTEERALVAAIVGFGAVAMAHAELYATSHAQAHELYQLLEISSELGSSSDLEQFLQAFVTRAADFLGFGRCFIALLEDDQFRVRYAVDRGQPRRAEVLFPEGIATQTLRAKEVFWTDEASRTPGANLEVVTKYNVQQFLAVPLLGNQGRLLGMFGVLDRLDGIGISQEDIRRARALSNQAAVMLEAASNLHLSEQHRRQAQALIDLAREIDGALRLPEFAHRFVSRTAELTGAKAGLLAVPHDDGWQIAAQYEHDASASQSITLVQKEEGTSELAEHLIGIPAGTPPQRWADDLERALATALAEYKNTTVDRVSTRAADQVIGATTAAKLGWIQCTVVRLTGADGELAGLLCLSSAVSSSEERLFLESMATHAAMALQNSRLFTRIEQANRKSLMPSQISS
jgi:GAF domain-containing protein